MAVSWYAPKPKQTVEVKVTKSSIVITESGMQKLAAIDPRFSEGGDVRLGWDPDRQFVAIAPASEGEKGAFKIARRGRNEGNRTINAAKFFAAFDLVVDELSPNVPVLITEDGLAFFKLNVLSAPPVPARPGRRRVAKAPA